MHSRAARLTCSTVAWLAIGGAAAFLIHSEREIADRRETTRMFHARAREAVDALADVRVAQQAYVAAGQNVMYWMPKVTGLTDSVAQSLATLRAFTTSAACRSALDEAAASVAGFTSVDGRVRDYLRSGESLMAGDVIFTEGNETAAAAARQIESARLADQQALDVLEAGRRRQEAAALTGVAAFAAIAMALLVPVRPGQPGAGADRRFAEALSTPSSATDELMLRESPGRAPAPAARPAPARGVSTMLAAAAQLCADLSRVTSLDDVTALLGRAANLMDASGLIVWVGSASGADLRPVLAHGYSPQALARLPTVPRSANNAAAAAYRSGTLQIVLARPGSLPGALVAPLLSPDGCIGALSAEIPGGGETSDSVQALATIFSAQLAVVLGAPEASEAKTAASG